MKSLTKTIALSANSSWYLYNFRQSTIKKAISEGYKVLCISPMDNYSLKLEDLGCMYYELNFNSKSINPFLDLILLYKFFKLYKLLRPDVAFHFTIKNNIYGTIASRFLGIPSINNISGLGTAFLSFSLSLLIVKFLYKISQPFAHKVFCQNIEDYNYLISKNLVQKEKLDLLPGSGVDLQRFNAELKSKKIRKESIFTFLYAGRMLKDKGILELVKAFSELSKVNKKCKLILCGFTDVDNNSAITEDELDLISNISNIEWIGSTDRIENILLSADCVVLPSYREGMPKILLEAGAMGLPSLASDVPGCRNVIQDEVNGLLFKPKSANSIKESMYKILKMSDSEISKMGLNARKIVEEQFDEQIVINKFLKVLNKL